MYLRHLQLATTLIKVPRTATSGWAVAGFKPVSLRTRSHPLRSKQTMSSMSLQEKIQFLHKYSACDVRLHSTGLWKVDIRELTRSGLGCFTKAAEASPR
jgi:hypothetical protein